MTQKKYLYTMLGVIALLLVIGVGTTYAKNQILRNNVISTTAAKNFAFLDAEVTEKEVTNLEIELDEDFGAYYYDIDFRLNGENYSYHVDATNGKIIAREVPIKLSIHETSPNTNTKEESKNNLSEVNTKNEKATNQGQLARENNQAIVQEKTKTISTPIKKEPKLNSPYLSVEKAKEISLNNAGVNQKDAIFESAKLERENGRDIYEVEFFTDKKEYDYEIDAHTGEILRYSSEKQDKIAPNIIKEKQNIFNKIEDMADDFDDRVDKWDIDNDEDDISDDWESDDSDEADYDDDYDSDNDNDD